MAWMSWVICLGRSFLLSSILWTLNIILMSWHRWEKIWLSKITILIKLLQILHALYRVSRVRCYHRAWYLWTIILFPLFEKLKVFMLGSIHSISRAIRLIYLITFCLCWYSSSHKWQHLACRFCPSCKAKVNRFSSLFNNRLSGFSTYFFILEQLVKTVKWFVCTWCSADHALTNIFITGKRIFSFIVRFLSIFRLEGSGYLSGHAV